jgi:hypothetical protein
MISSTLTAVMVVIVTLRVVAKSLGLTTVTIMMMITLVVAMRMMITNDLGPLPADCAIRARGPGGPLAPPHRRQVARPPLRTDRRAVSWQGGK